MLDAELKPEKSSRRKKSLEEPALPSQDQQTDSLDIVSRARLAAQQACRWFFAQQKDDGHWCAELESNSTITAEYVFMRQALGLGFSRSLKEQLQKYLLGHQKEDGSWGIAWNHNGDVSTTVEVYLALRLLEVSEEHPALAKAAGYIREHGGLEKVRVFTRINLACFGLFPWDAIPIIPPEFILLPPKSPINIYRLSSWARSTMVPLFIICHHRPTFSLPNGTNANNNWLDHLWLNPSDKRVPYREDWMTTLKQHGASYQSFFTAADEVLGKVDSLRTFPVWDLLSAKASSLGTVAPLAETLLSKAKQATEQYSPRRLAIQRCEQWILERQEASGDWAGIFPPMVNGVIALCLNGHDLGSDPVKRGLQAIENFAIQDDLGFRVQACVSPVWDTVLGMIGLIDSGTLPSDERLARARTWVESEQILVNYGDWKVYNPSGVSGGWAFEYENTWYPDVDDSAAAVLALLKQDQQSTESPVVLRALDWIASMQNSDGGWAAFDKDNNKLYLNKIPFSDMDSLCDPSSPDVTGRILEAMGLWRHLSGNSERYKDAIEQGLSYIRRTQEPEGSWFGRWGVNYVYGTSNVLCGLSQLGIDRTDPMVETALAWLKQVQNQDGGFGEKLESYSNRAYMGIGDSTASQTAWGAMGLLAFEAPSDPTVKAAIAWLMDHQNREGSTLGSWDEKEFTGTGFPNHFYLRYHFYRQFFPMMALGRFVEKAAH